MLTFMAIARAKAYKKKGTMNKTEADYAALLEDYKKNGDISNFYFEAYTLKLGKDCRYTPDFAVILNDGEIEFHEVKGFWRDDAKAKLRIAARMFPHRFRCVQKSKSGWDITDYTDETL